MPFGCEEEGEGVWLHPPMKKATPPPLNSVPFTPLNETQKKVGC